MANFILTITGADDTIDPIELVRLSKEYPFVEWGILFSHTAFGEKRFPSKEWRSTLYADIMGSTEQVNLSAHLCGSFVDQRLESNAYLTTEVEMFYRRIQFNKFNEENCAAILEYAADTSTPVILPSSKKSREIIKAIGPGEQGLSVTDQRSRLSVLHDSSGGRGVSPDVWPDHMKDYFLTGYAGGLKEENIESTIAQLGARYGDKPFWVDLETGARDGKDNFGLPQVERILAKASGYYGESRIKLI